MTTPRRTLALAIPLAVGLTLGAPPAPAHAAGLDVMSYNVNWGAPDGRRLDEVARVIARSGADVVGVQQVRRFARRAKKGDYRCQDQATRLADALSRLTGERWAWVYAANTSRRQSSRHCRSVTSRPRQEGVLVLSRYPVTGRATYRLPYERTLALARVRVPGHGAVNVYTVHLDSTSRRKRTVQAREVARIVRDGGTAFLTGDMNDGAGRPPVRALASVARDSWAEKGRGSGATRRGRIDYVFYRGLARVDSVTVIRASPSDHRPVLARFTLPSR